MNRREELKKRLISVANKLSFEKINDSDFNSDFKNLPGDFWEMKLKILLEVSSEFCVEIGDSEDRDKLNSLSDVLNFLEKQEE